MAEDLDVQPVPSCSRRRLLQRQLELVWRFAQEVVLPQVDRERCLWEPGDHVVTVRERSGQWFADWPDERQHPLPEATIGWLLWHIEWWWTNAIRTSRGQLPVPADQHCWSGSTAGIIDAKAEWCEVLATVDLDGLVDGLMPTRQPFAFVAAWVNFELTKNVSEIHQLLVRRSNGPHRVG